MTNILSADIQEKILALEAAVKGRLPNMPMLLKEIHGALRKDPDCVTLLKEEQIAVLISGLERQTNTYIVATVTKSKSAASILKKLTADDL